MSQLMNKILKEYCEQDSEAYQIGVVLIEEESRNTISKHVCITIAIRNY